MARLWSSAPDPTGRRARALAAADPLGLDAGLQPCEGPSRAEREMGRYDLLFTGRTRTGDRVRISVTGDRDPGYGSTPRMIVETALRLRDGGRATPAGMWTPGAALGPALIDRLQAHAGLRFRVEPSAPALTLHE